MKSKYLLPVLVVLCIVTITVMIVALFVGGDDTEKFVPPPFETQAQSGLPEVENDSWSKIYQQGMSFMAYVCGRVTISDNKAEVYFTSAEENEVWIKLRIFDKNGNMLGESGLLRPNEYVEFIELDKIPNDGDEISLKIMAYEPNTYYSAGSVELNTTIVGGGE